MRRTVPGKWLVGIVLVALVAATAVLVLSSRGSDDALVVYNARSHYGQEEAFAAFTRETGIEVELFGGDAETLYQRLLSEGDRTPADVLVTVDGANLWRAKQAGLLLPIRSAVIDEYVPADYRDADGTWTAISTRVRTPMRSTTRVGPDEIRTYADLGDPKWKGRLCLRTSNNIYNQSMVADFIAKRGEAATEQMLRSWMANQPKILGSDLDVLKAIEAGQCDVGVTNNYYLARLLDENADFPVAPVWVEQSSAGAHGNLSGASVVRSSDRAAQAQQLVEFLVRYDAQRSIASNGEFPVNPAVPPADHVAGWAGVRIDPIDVDAAGSRAQDAVSLMVRVGWQ